MKKCRVILAIALMAIMVLPSTGLAQFTPQGEVGAYTANGTGRPSHAPDFEAGVAAAQSGRPVKSQGESKASGQEQESVGEVGANLAGYDMPYYVRVSLSGQKVEIYSQDASGRYSVLEKSFSCSTGLDSTPTPTGLFYMKSSRPSWSYFKTYGVYVRYAVRFHGDYFFHSVLYQRKDADTLIKSSYNNIGKKASHGCIRLYLEDAKWLSNHCAGGTAVEIVK